MSSNKFTFVNQSINLDYKFYVYNSSIFKLNRKYKNGNQVYYSCIDPFGDSNMNIYFVIKSILNFHIIKLYISNLLDKITFHFKESNKTKSKFFKSCFDFNSHEYDNIIDCEYFFGPISIIEFSNLNNTNYNFILNQLNNYNYSINITPFKKILININDDENKLHFNLEGNLDDFIFNNSISNLIIISELYKSFSKWINISLNPYSKNQNIHGFLNFNFKSENSIITIFKFDHDSFKYTTQIKIFQNSDIIIFVNIISKQKICPKKILKYMFNDLLNIYTQKSPIIFYENINYNFNSDLNIKYMFVPRLYESININRTDINCDIIKSHIGENINEISFKYMSSYFINIRFYSNIYQTILSYEMPISLFLNENKKIDELYVLYCLSNVLKNKTRTTFIQV